MPVVVPETREGFGEPVVECHFKSAKDRGLASIIGPQVSAREAGNMESFSNSTSAFEGQTAGNSG